MATPVWFDAAHYKAQKLAQLLATDSNGAWTAEKLDGVMETAGFGGNEGWFNHFTAYGAGEHCSPNALFNAAEYLTAKLAQLEASDKAWVGRSVADVQAAFKAAGLGEWEHYQQYGMSEGLNPSNAFDEIGYLNAKLEQLIKVDPENWTGKGAPEVRGALQAAGLSALEHYELFGKGEGITVVEVPAEDKVTVPGDFFIFGGKGGMPSAGFDLTRGTDNLTGTAGNDSFFAGDANGFQTLNPTDTLNGGAGEDTIYIAGNINAGAFAAATITNIENVVTNFGSVNVSANADVKNVTIQASGTVTGKMAQNVTFENFVDNKSAEAIFVDATGKEDAVTVKLANNGNMNTLKVNNVEKLTFEVTGKNVQMASDKESDIDFTANALQELVVTGEGSVRLAGAGTAGAAGGIKSLDFTANKGGVEFSANTTQVAKAVTVKGGVGDDAVNIASATTAGIKFDVDMGAGNDLFAVHTNVKKDSVIKGGEGTDTLVLNTVGTSETFGKMFESFEKVRLEGAATYVGSHFKGVSDVSVVAGNNVVAVDEVSDLTLTGTGAITSLTLTGAKILDLTFDNGKEGDVAGAGTQVTTLFASGGATNINIHSEGYVSTANLIDNITASASLTSITIDGDQDIVIGSDASGTAGAWTTVTGLARIDASGLTGDLTLDVTTAALKAGAEITGGAGDDTFIVAAGNFGAALKGGAGNDTYDVKAAATGQDPTTAANLTGKFTVITDFEKGDKIELGGTIDTIKVVAYDATGVNQTLSDLCKDSGAASISWFSDTVNSYIVYNTGGASTTATDIIVKLQGVAKLDGVTVDDGVISWA